MIAENIESKIRGQLTDQLDIEQQSANLLRICLPYTYADGDHVEFYLEKARTGGWSLTDDGCVCAKTSEQGVDLSSGSRKSQLNQILEFYNASTESGEIKTPVKGHEFAEAISRFTQVLFECSRIPLLKQSPSVGKSNPNSEFRDSISEIISGINCETHDKDWHHPNLDPNGKYSVDHRFKGNGSDILLFPVGNNIKLFKATTTALYYRQLEFDFDSIAVLDHSKPIPVDSIAILNDSVELVFDVGDPALTETLKNRLAA